VRPHPKAWRTVALLAGGAVVGAVVAVAAIPAYRALAQNYPTLTTQPVTTAQEAQGAPAVAVYHKLSPSIVLVTNQSTTQGFAGTASQTAWGSGVIFNSAGYIVTNDHVVNGATKITVTLADGKVYRATLVGGDPSTDLAVIRIHPPTSLPAATFANSNDVQPGEVAIAIGNPLGPQFAQSVTEGIVGAVRPMLYGFNQQTMRVTKMIQTDAPINPGNSGGALANAQGEVIGITSMKVAQSGGANNITAIGLGFAIPSNTVQKIVDELVRYGYVKRAWLGVTITENPSTALPNQAQTVMVAQVSAGGPSAGKLQPSDVITAWDGKTILNYYDLVADINAAQPGQTAHITVRRGGHSVVVSITLGQEPRSLEQSASGTASSSTAPAPSSTIPGLPFPFPYGR
jgi:serine protease Do